MQAHPFLNNNVVGVSSFPSQMIPLSEKKKPEFGEKMMATLESIGRMQYFKNIGLEENIRMCNGEFLTYQYENSEENQYLDLLHEVQKEFKTSKKLRHFDFLNQIIETLLGEFDTHPDTFSVEAKGEAVMNQREAEKGKMLLDYIMQDIQADIASKLEAQGYDLNKQDFTSEEEAQAYQQEIAQQTKALTPPEIQYYFDNKWQHVAEKWANIQLDDDKYRYDLVTKERNEFKQFCQVGKCFRHFYLTATGYNQESWDWRHTFHQRSTHMAYPEDGNYIGRSIFMTVSDVIDRDGHILPAEKIEKLKGVLDKDGDKIQPKDWMGNKISYLSPEGMPYMSRIPTNNADLLNLLPQVKNTTNIANAGYYLNDDLDYNSYINNIVLYTEAYWKSQKQLFKLKWVNPVTRTPETIIVDETFDMPDYITVYKGTLFNEEQEINTAESTWVNCIYQGKKITPLNGQMSLPEPIVYDVKEAAFQGKSDSSIYGCSFPVVGQEDANPIVNKIKSFQIAHNMFLNQAWLIAEEEILPFLAIDPNIMHKDKDWGGEEGFIKWWESVKSLRTAMIETRPHMTNGANTGNQFPQVVDMDVSSRLESRLSLAQAMKQLGLEQIGFNPQRMSQINPYETAQNVQSAIQGSYAQTSSIFFNFYNYKRRCLKKNLDFAQYVQVNNKDFTVSGTKSDQTRAWLNLNGTDLLGVDLHVYVVNTQEQVRKLEMIRRLGVENNTLVTKLSDRIEMATSDSIQAIKEIIKISEEETSKMQQNEQAMKQQELDQAMQAQRESQAFEAEQNQLDREAKHQDTYMTTFGYAQNNLSDADNNGTLDILEYEKNNQKVISDGNKNNIAMNKQMLDKQKLSQQQIEHKDKMYQNALKMRNEKELALLKIKQAKVQGDKSK
jgi:hypothetical protein